LALNVQIACKGILSSILKMRSETALSNKGILGGYLKYPFQGIGQEK